MIKNVAYLRCLCIVLVSAMLLFSVSAVADTSIPTYDENFSIRNGIYFGMDKTLVKEKEKEAEKWPEVYRNIMSGYDRVAGLTEEEKKAIPYVILTNQFVCVAWFAEQGKYEEMFRANIAMTEWIFAHFDKLQLTENEPATDK